MSDLTNAHDLAHQSLSDAEQALAAGKRPWIERVGVKDPGVIVIQDGQGGS